MTMHTITGSLIVKPETEPVFSELATTVRIDDEGAGPFVRVVQEGRDDARHGITIDATEWPAIRDAIERMLEVVAGQGGKS